MAMFNLDEDTILGVIEDALEYAAYSASEEQFENIANDINTALPGIMDLIVYGVRDFWRDEAQNSGTGWGAKYSSAIQAKVTGDKGEVFVDESLIDKTSGKSNMLFVSLVENGMKSFSIKDALLKSDKAKVGPAGIRYIHVPLPVRTPKTNKGTKMASKFGGREMSQQAYKILKEGGRFSGKLKSGEEVSGLTRYVTRQRHSQYGIFLTVSEKSSGWVHPGVPESPVYPKVLDEINQKVGEILSNFMKDVVREYTT